MIDKNQRFKMRFIGKPNGVFLKGAPGNYVHGKEYMMPFRHSAFAYWELMEEPPVLRVDESPDDSVFEEAVYIPDDEEAVVEFTVSAPIDEMVFDVDPEAPAIIEPFMTYNTGTGLMSTYVEPTPEPEIEDALDETPLTRKELLKALAEADVEVKKGTRTTTLRKMVDELVP